MIDRKEWTSISILLLVVFCLLSLYTWRAKICFNPDEIFYYKSSQAINSIKDLFAPRYFEAHRFQKPPIFYALVFSSFKLFGVNWFSARIVSVFSSILVLLMTYVLGLRLFDRKKAFLATGILATTVLFFRFGRIVLPEMLLIFFMTAALYFAYRGFSERLRSFFYGSFICMSLASLVKGPIGFILPVIVISVFYIINRKEKSLMPVPWVKGALILLGANLLWFIPGIIFYGKEFLGHFLNVEVADRLKDEAPRAGLWLYLLHKAGKFLFYIPVTFAEYLPWSVIIPVIFFWKKKELVKKKYKLERRFLITWVVAGLIIFSVVAAKRAHYVLCVFPALSLYLASFLDLEKSNVKKVFHRLLYITLGVYLAAVIIVFPYIFSDGVDVISVKLREELKNNNAPVAVSWRLDPQEIELYLDKPVTVIWESNYLQEGPAGSKIREMVSGSEGEKEEQLFYIILAQKEFEEYFGTFFSYLKKMEKSPVVYSVLFTDKRWRKTIDFKEFLSSLIKEPGAIGKHFNKYFKEDVHVILLYRE